MTREYAEAYVKYGSKRAPALDDLSVGVWVCGIFVVPCVAAGIGNGRPFFAILSLIALISCGVAIEICKQKVKQWTYFQRFLLRGGYPLAMSVAILLMGLSVWESQMEGALWCELVTLGIWLFGMGLCFYIPWRKANKGVYYQLSKVHRTNKWRMKRIMERKSVIAGGSGAAAGYMGMSVARATFPHMSRGVVIAVGVAAILLVSLIFGTGSSDLLRAYYVKKYDLQGKTTPVWWGGDGAGKSLGWRILDAAKKVGKVLVGIIAFSVLATVVVFLFMRWLPAWLGHR